jgi:phosphate:Na+ symporter
MNLELTLNILFEVIGGLGVFLIGMRYMSDGMQAVAGDRLRYLINAVTNNRLLACSVGVLVTSLIQSSSITTVMAVGMVNAGIMNLTQSIGVVLGANIGTTVTAWILCIKIGHYGLPLIGISSLFYLFGKKQKIKYSAMLFLGLGFIFYGLVLMKNGFKPLQEQDAFIEWFSRFSPHNYIGVLKCCLVGAALTAIVQSSSATIGITISLATIGVIDYQTAAALVLGENIGTTITAYLASLGASVNAKRASYAHVFVNLFGVAWITTIFFVYIKFIVMFIGKDPGMSVIGEDGMAIYPNAAPFIAATHTCFNVLNVIILLPFIKIIAKILEKLVPEKAAVPVSKHLVQLDERLMATPAIGIEMSQKETSRMLDKCLVMMDCLAEMVSNQKFSDAQKEYIFNTENELDIVQKEIAEFLTALTSSSELADVRVDCARQLRIADELESVSDYIANLLKLNLKVQATHDEISGEGLTGLLSLHNSVKEFMVYIKSQLAEPEETELAMSTMMCTHITRSVKSLRSRHLERVGNGEVSPLKSLSYTDMLSSYRKIKDHMLNVAEIIAGEK